MNHKGIILCDDILEIIGMNVEKIRNYQWWVDNYGYHLPSHKFILNYNQLYLGSLKRILFGRIPFL